MFDRLKRWYLGDLADPKSPRCPNHAPVAVEGEDGVIEISCPNCPMKLFVRGDDCANL